MAVSDLTNTTWVLNASVSQLSDSYYASGYINYHINDLTPTYKSITELVMTGLHVEVAFHLSGTNISTLYCFYTSQALTSFNAAVDSAGWYKRVSGTTSSNLVLEKMTDPLMISITSGTKTTDATLIAWLEANATQINVTDLTNTKWLFHDDPLDISTASYSINFTSNNQNFTELVMTRQSSLIRYMSYDNLQVYDGDTFTNDVYKTIEIAGGTDATNYNLIAWLTNNATQQAPTPTSSILNIYSNDERATSYGIYVQGGSYLTPTKVATVQRVSTIEFGISDGSTTTTYQAESSMTWSQWVNSAYNTESYYIKSNNEVAYGGDAYPYYVGIVQCGFSQLANQTINANQTYIKYYVPGCD